MNGDAFILDVKGLQHPNNVKTLHMRRVVPGKIVIHRFPAPDHATMQPVPRGAGNTQYFAELAGRAA
jgi:hypothetical protein